MHENNIPKSHTLVLTSTPFLDAPKFLDFLIHGADPTWANAVLQAFFSIDYHSATLILNGTTPVISTPDAIHITTQVH